MATLEYFLVCEQVINDKETNATTIVNVLEELPTPHFPLVLPKCMAISLWRPDPNDFEADWQVTLRVHRPGAAPDDIATNFQFAREDRAHRITQVMFGMPVHAEGELRFEVLLNGEHRATHVVPVFKSEAPLPYTKPSPTNA